MSIYIALLSRKSLIRWTRYSIWRKARFSGPVWKTQSCCARRSSGKESQTMGPCTANARRPTVDSRCRGTTISCCVADLKRCLPTTSVTGVQQSTRYCGTLSCRHPCMMTPSLYVTRSANFAWHYRFFHTSVARIILALKIRCQICEWTDFALHDSIRIWCWLSPSISWVWSGRKNTTFVGLVGLRFNWQIVKSNSTLWLMQHYILTKASSEKKYN